MSLLPTSSLTTASSVSSVDKVAARMGELSLTQASATQASATTAQTLQIDPSTKKKETEKAVQIITRKTLASLSTDALRVVGSFLGPVQMWAFLQVSQSCKAVGHRMLLDNHGAMSAILNKANGEIREIPEPLQSKVRAAASSIKRLFVLKVTAQGMQDIVTTFTALENLNFFPILPHPVDFKRLYNLEVLELDGKKTWLNDAALTDLATCTKLTSLSLRGFNNVSSSGYNQLSNLKNLRFLNLSQSPIDAGGLLALTKVRNLETLILRECRSISALGFLGFFHPLACRDRELSDLSEYGLHVHLQELDVSDSQINEISLLCIRSIKTLKWLNVSNCERLTKENCKILQPAFHNLQKRIKKADLDGLFKYKLHLAAQRVFDNGLFTTNEGFNELLASLPYATSTSHFVCKLTEEFDAVTLGQAFRAADPEDIPGMIRDFALLVGRDQILLHTLFLHDCTFALRKHDLKAFKPRDLSEILWIFAKLGYKDERLFNLFANEIAQRDLKRFSATEITNIIDAFSNLEIRNKKLFKQLADEISSREDFTSDQFKSIHAAYEKFGLKC